MNLRVIIEKESRTAYENMARDEAICTITTSAYFDYRASINSKPTLRFYGWKSPGAISLGINQNTDQISKRILMARKWHTPIVRRFTAGDGVFHGPDDLTYSLTIPYKHLPSDFPFKGQGQGKSRMKLQYQYMVENYLVKAFNELGIEAEYHGLSDILVNGRLISGSAIKESIVDDESKTFFIHGTILNHYNEPFMRSVFTGDIPLKTIGLDDLGISLQKYREALIDVIANGEPPTREIDLSKKELNRAEILLRGVYSKDEWNLNHGTVSRGTCYRELD